MGNELEDFCGWLSDVDPVFKRNHCFTSGTQARRRQPTGQFVRAQRAVPLPKM
jgi:hypothetical protein